MSANGTNGDARNINIPNRIPDGIRIHLSIPIGVLAIKELSSEEKIVLACLMQNFDERVDASPVSIIATARFLSMTTKEVADIMFELEKKSMVAREPEGFKFFDHPCYHMFLKRSSDNGNEGEDEPW
jgi:hypothetical protein